MNPLNLVKKGISGIFNKLSLCLIKDSVLELSGSNRRRNENAIAHKIKVANFFAEIAVLIGARDVTTEVIFELNQFCSIRSTQRLFNFIRSHKVLDVQEKVRANIRPKLDPTTRLPKEPVPHNFFELIEGFNKNSYRGYKLFDELHSELKCLGLQSDSHISLHLDRVKYHLLLDISAPPFQGVGTRELMKSIEHWINSAILVKKRALGMYLQ